MRNSSVPTVSLLFLHGLGSVLNLVRPDRYSEVATLPCVSQCQCKVQRPVRFRTPPQAVHCELQHVDDMHGVDLRRLGAAQCSSVLCAVLLSHCLPVLLFLCCRHTCTHTHTHTLACTLKSSLHTVGKTGVTDWMLPPEYFSAALL